MFKYKVLMLSKFNLERIKCFRLFLSFSRTQGYSEFFLKRVLNVKAGFDIFTHKQKYVFRLLP